ncbi:MAG: hypothetical protein PWP65_7 [Clostridia bacterium]|nr:hypothetical protein [Clostridia bacterium]
MRRVGNEQLVSSAELTVGDIITLYPVRTVVRLADAQDPVLRRQLLESFVLTDDGELALAAVLQAMSNGEGRGFFLHGHYGSGKSHLLSVLGLMLTDPGARKILTAGDDRPWPGDLVALLKKLENKRYLVAEISLVEHSNREYLEEIVLQALQEKLKGMAGAGLPSQEYRRREYFARLGRVLRDNGLAGMVLLLDELSEFLRSKPDSRTFNEDIRFLQFLGEKAPDLPCWIVATLQEQLEETGAIPPESFNKIKDRYPIRLRLGGGHIREIIARRLVPKKEGAVAHLKPYFAALQRAFPYLPFSWEDYLELYPVHPLAVPLLDELRLLFSQRRGVIEFVYTHLRGDPGRRIEGFLERPLGAILSPVAIFDYFLDRLRELPETNIYLQRAYRFFEREISNIFSDKREQELALNLVKLLILAALRPTGRSLKVKDLAHLLLCRVSQIEPRFNYEYLHELLQRLYQGGAYLAVKPGQDPLEDAFTIDLEADVQLLVRRRVDYLKKDLFPDDRRLVDDLLTWLDEPALPLAGLPERSRRQFNWQKTPRQGLLLFKHLGDMGAEEIASLARETAETEVDLVIFLARPGDREDMLPLLPENVRTGFLFWLPATLTSEESETLTECWAYRKLAMEYANDHTPAGVKVKSYLKNILTEKKKQVQEIYRRLYFQGRLFDGTGALVSWALNPAYMGLDQTIERLADGILQARYPRHIEIAPISEIITEPVLQRLIEEFLLPGEVNARTDPGLRLALEGFMQPMGLVKKVGGVYRLHIDPQKNPLVAAFLAGVEGGEAPLEEVYRRLRKGPFGLSRNAFHVLGLALLYSGIVVALQRGRRVSLQQLSAYNFWKIESLARGEVLPPRFLKILSEVRFLPAKFKKEIFSYATQQEVWEYLINFKKEAGAILEEVRQRLEQVQKYPALAILREQNLRESLEQVAALLEEIKVSYAPQEGLARFLTAYQASPFWERHWQRVSSLHTFLVKQLDRYLFICGYLSSPQLVLPEEEPYRELARQRQNLLHLAQNEEIFFAGGYERLEKEFNLFQEAYAELYLAGHEKQRSPRRFEAYLALKETATYRALNLLAQVRALAVPHDLAYVEGRLQDILARQCTAADRRLLTIHPSCFCGFRLGEKEDLAGPALIQQEMEQGLAEYLRALQEPACAQKLRSFIGGLLEVGRQKQAARMQKLLELDPESGEDLARFLALMNRNLIEDLNKALAGSNLVAERDLGELCRLLAGRVFTQEQIRAVFERWLQGEEVLGPETYIRVHGEADKQGPAARIAAEGRTSRLAGRVNIRTWVTGSYPELLPFLDKWGLQNFFLALATCWWMAAHGLEATNVRMLSDLGPFADPDILKRLAAPVGELRQARPELRQEVREVAEQVLQDRGWQELYWEFLIAGRDRGIRLWIEILRREEVFTFILERGTIYLGQELAHAGGYDLKEAIAELKAGEEEGAFLARQAYLSACRTFADLLKRLNDLEAALNCKHLDTPQAWEELYRDDLGLLEHIYARAVAQITALGLAAKFPLELNGVRMRRLLMTCRRQFEDFYRRVPEKDLKERRLDVLFDRVASLYRRQNAAAVKFILLDGMRWDIWELVKRELRKSELKLKVMEEGFCWAVLPTVTETQLELLGERLAKVVNCDEEGGLFDLDDCLLKFNFIDAEVHRSSDDYLAFTEEIILKVQRRLLPFLEALPSGSLVVLFADHGFAINYNYRHKEEPRYLHGGCSLQEVLVPWAICRC